jgi:hypothetical protein
MGSCRQKRRKKLAKEWAEFQARHELSDADMKLVRTTSYTLKAVQEKLSDSEFAEELSVIARIREILRRWQQNLAARQEASASGDIEPKKKTAKKQIAHDPQWSKAKELCQLNLDDSRKAKELGLSPRALINNIPNSSQRWKTPVKQWLRDLYEERQQRSARKQGLASSPAQPESVRSDPEQFSHDSVVKDWESHAKRNDDENLERPAVI